MLGKLSIYLEPPCTISVIFSFFFFSSPFFLCFFNRSYTPHIASAIGSSSGKYTYTSPLVHCTRHMCPIRVHWHVKKNYKEYWRVMITITNFNYRMNYSHWNIVVQHPNFSNLTESFSFNYKLIPAYESISKMM